MFLHLIAMHRKKPQVKFWLDFSQFYIVPQTVGLISWTQIKKLN